MFSRGAALAEPLLIILVFCVGIFVGVVRYTSVLDPSLVGASGVVVGNASLHRGPPPCLRYPVPPAPGSVREAAVALAASGFSARELSEVSGELDTRIAAQEAPLHERGELDEYLDARSRGSTLLDRLVITLKRDLLRAQLAAMVGTPPARTSVIWKLQPEPRKAFEAEWTRDPSVFVAGPFDLTRALHVATTERILDATLATLQAQVEQGGEPRLDSVVHDDWAGSLVLERTAPDELTLMSFGGDGVVGGVGADADLTRKLVVKFKR